MSKKHAIYAIGLFLGILFLSTIGTMYTGYAILPQDQLTFQHYPYPFIRSGVYNNLFIVVSDSATLDELDIASNLAKSLQGSLPLAPEIVSVNNLPEGNYNLILIGDPCTNNLISNELNTNECSLGLKEHQGLLQLINHDKTSSLIISGYDLQGILKASKVLLNHDSFPFKGNRIIVDGNLNNLYSLTLKY